MRSFVANKQKYPVILVLCIIVIGLSTSNSKDAMSCITSYDGLLDEDKKDRDIQYNVNVDYINNGLADYYRTGNKMDYIKRICASKGCKVQMALFKGVDHNKESVARIGTLVGYMLSDLFCVHQTQYNGEIYEYWMLKQWCRRFGYGYMYCEFFITKAQSQKERRIIIYQSNYFFRDYKIDNKFSVIFPQERYRPMILGHGFDRCQQIPR